MTGVELRNLVKYFAARPGRLVVVGVALWQLRARGWWRRSPFLPLPGRRYWEFRLVTAQGIDSPELRGDDIVAAAQWARRQRGGR